MIFHSYVKIPEGSQSSFSQAAAVVAAGDSLLVPLDLHMQALGGMHTLKNNRFPWLNKPWKPNLGLF